MSDGGLAHGPSAFSSIRDIDALESTTREDTHGLNRQEKDHDGKAQP
jgi:hypothetical protein